MPFCLAISFKTTEVAPLLTYTPLAAPTPLPTLVATPDSLELPAVKTQMDFYALPSPFDVLRIHKRALPSLSLSFPLSACVIQSNNDQSPLSWQTKNQQQQSMLAVIN